MKFLKSAISLLNKNNFKNSHFLYKRFYCSTKSSSDENSKNVDISKQKHVEVEVDQPDRIQYNTAIEKDLSEGIIISSYNTMGFRLNKYVQVIGPVIIFPRNVFSWHLESVENISAESLMIFGLVQPKVDMLIIGIGDGKASPEISKNILQIAQKFKINFEILTTELACTQFNYLNSEGRMVAAALVPPKGQTWREDDIFQTLNFDNKLFTIDNMHTPDVRYWNKKS